MEGVGRIAMASKLYVNLENLVLSDKLMKVELPPQKIWKTHISNVSPLSERMSRSHMWTEFVASLLRF